MIFLKKSNGFARKQVEFSEKPKKHIALSGYFVVFHKKTANLLFIYCKRLR